MKCILGVIAKYFLRIGLNVKFLGNCFLEKKIIKFGLSLIQKVNQMKTRLHSTTLDNTRLMSIAKAALSKLYVFLTMCALMLNSINLLAQADSIPTYSSFGIFDKVIDRFGQDLSWSDLKINPATSSSRFILNKGVFEIHFYPGSGFELANDPTHINRRAVIDELFNVANSIWGTQMSNDKVIVRFLPMPQSIAYGQDYPLLASSYYVVPQFTANFSEASDCIIAQYIQSSENPYQTLGDFNTKLQIASNNLQFSHLDFYCNLSNYNININLQTATIASNQIDLYSVALRELLVGLGVNSLLNQTGQSISANVHQFSRWDTQLQFQSQSLITYNSAQKKYIPSALNPWLSNLPAPTANCASLYTCAQSPYFIDGTKSIAVSHCYKQGLELNYLNEVCSTAPVVLNRSWMSGTVRRKLSSSDLSVLQSLGYSLNGCFGITTNHNDFCAQVSGVGKFTRFTSSSPNQTFLGIIEANSTQKISINTLVQSNPSITSIEYIDHIGGPSVFSLSNDSISVSNFQKSRNVLRFLLTNNQGDKLSAFALLALRGGEVCEGGDCNLVSNNGFEELTGNQQCGWFDLTPPFLTNIPYVNVDCWSPFTGTPDIYSVNCINPNYDFTNGPIPDDLGGNIPWDTQVQANIIRLRTYINNSIEEAIQTELLTPLIPGVSYEISMRIFRRAGNDPFLRVYFRNGEYLGDAAQINDPAAFNLVTGPGVSVSGGGQNQWQEWTGTFQVPANNSNLNYLVIANENVGQPTQSANRQLFIDNVRIRPIQAASFNIPQSSICSGNITGLQEFASPAGGVVTGPGITAPNFTFNSALVNPGSYTLTYTVTDNIGCILTATDQIIVQPVVTFPNTNITPICGNTCSGAITISPVVSAPANVVYTWTGPSINTGNQNSFSLTNLCTGTYTITALVNGICQYSQTFIVPANPLPTLSVTQEINDCATGCNTSILVTSSIPNGTISWTGGLSGFNPTGVCAGTYTATVNTPSPCQAAPVTVTVAPQTLQTLNLNNSATWTTSNEYDNITLASGALLQILGNTNVTTINGTITVTNGTGLLIAGANVRFGPSGRIIVQPGGRVYVQSAKLTANCPNLYWRGIEVRGSISYSQNDISLSSNLTLPATNNDGLTNQGGIWIDKNSLIEYADIAVKLYQGTIDTDNMSNTQTTNSGGFIRADESTFRNNRRDIAFSRYGTANYSNLSSFRRCTFEVNTNHFTSGDILRERVLIRQTYSVIFEGCTWINSSLAIANNNNSQASNTNPNTLDDQAALRLITGHCTLNQFVSGSTIIPCRFLGFIYGLSSNGSYLSQALIVNNVVFRCYRSVRASSLAGGSVFNKCDFGAINSLPSPITIAIPPTFVNSPATTPWVNNSINNNGDPTTWLNGPSYGIYLQSPGATTIKNNNFVISGSTSNQRVGLYINNGGANIVSVVDNVFRGNSFGIRFFNTNRNSGTPAVLGTTFRCNEFLYNDLHVEINAHNSSSSSAGINENILFAPNTSLSNIFDDYQSPINSLPAGRNIWDNVITVHNYVGRPQEVSNNLNRVQGFDSPLSLTTDYLGNIPSQECGTTSISVAVEDLLADYDIKKQTLENFKDDGSPEYYQYLIETLNSSNLVQRFNELSGASPSLSVDRIIEILNKESDLPRSMLLNILMSNISSLKNGESLSKLDSLQTPLNSSEKESLFALFSNIDAKGILECQVNEAAFKLYNAISEELTSVLLDTLITNKTSALEDFNSKLNIISSGHCELMNAQNDFNYNLIISIVNNRLLNIRESSMESKDLIKLKELIEETMSYGATDSTIQLNYDGFASNYIFPDLPMTYRMTDLIINKFDPSGYHGDLEYHFGIPNTRSAFKPNPKEIRYGIKAFPNPASTYVQIQSQVEDISDSIMIVRDLTGREIPVEVITKSKNEWVIDVNEWVNGSYIIELRKEGKINSTNQLIIQR